MQRTDCAAGRLMHNVYLKTRTRTDKKTAQGISVQSVKWDGVASQPRMRARRSACTHGNPHRNTKRSLRIFGKYSTPPSPGGRHEIRGMQSAGARASCNSCESGEPGKQVHYQVQSYTARITDRSEKNLRKPNRLVHRSDVVVNPSNCHCASEGANPLSSNQDLPYSSESEGGLGDFRPGPGDAGNHGYHGHCACAKNPRNNPPQCINPESSGFLVLVHLEPVATMALSNSGQSNHDDKPSNITQELPSRCAGSATGLGHRR